MTLLLESRAIPEKFTISTDPSEIPQTSAPESSNTSRLEKLALNSVTELTKEHTMPTQLVEKYITLALNRSLVETMENGDFFIMVPLLVGVWGTGNTLQDAEKDLRETIYEWLELKIEDQDRDIPVIESLDLNWL